MSRRMSKSSIWARRSMQRCRTKPRRAWRASRATAGWEARLAQHLVDHRHMRGGVDGAEHVGVVAPQPALVFVELGDARARRGEARSSAFGDREAGAIGKLDRVAIVAIAADAHGFGHAAPAFAEEILLEEHTHGVEAAPVHLARPDAPEVIQVLGGRAALVAAVTLNGACHGRRAS